MVVVLSSAVTKTVAFPGTEVAWVIVVLALASVVVAATVGILAPGSNPYV